MAHLSPDTLLSKNSDQVIERVVDGEVLMIHLSSGDYFSLDPVGTRVWQSVDGQRTVEELVQVVLDEYDVDRERAAADVLRLVEQLADEGLLVPQ